MGYGKITIGGRDYVQFIPYPQAVRDGTLRCISCGQIDEDEVHDASLCPAQGGALPQTENAQRFIRENSISPVISGSAFKKGGGTYQLRSRKRFRFTLYEIRSFGDFVPRWDLREDEHAPA